MSRRKARKDSFVIPIRIMVTEADDDAVRRHAAKLGTTVSNLLRSYIRRGLFQDDADGLCGRCGAFSGDSHLPWCGLELPTKE
jgi:hypothetical protein